MKDDVIIQFGGQKWRNVLYSSSSLVWPQFTLMFNLLKTGLKAKSSGEKPKMRSWWLRDDRMSVGLDESLQSLCELVNLLPPHISTAAQWGCALFPQHVNMFTMRHAKMLSLHGNHFLIHYLPYVPFLMFGIYLKIKLLITECRNHHRYMWPKS